MSGPSAGGSKAQAGHSVRHARHRWPTFLAVNLHIKSMMLVQVRSGYPDAWIIILLMPRSVQWVNHSEQNEMYAAYSNGMKQVAHEAAQRGLQGMTLLPVLAGRHIQHLGTMSHPDVETHQLMAAELAELILTRLARSTVTNLPMPKKPLVAIISKGYVDDFLCRAADCEEEEEESC